MITFLSQSYTIFLLAANQFSKIFHSHNEYFLSKFCVLLRPVLFPATDLVSFNKVTPKRHTSHCNFDYHV